MLKNEQAELAGHLRLQTWMSAAFPVGAYSSSHGLETAIQDGRVHDMPSCRSWIDSILRHGSGWNDALFTHQAYQLVSATDCHDTRPAPCVTHIPESAHTMNHAAAAHGQTMQQLRELNALVLALVAGAERLQETTQLGSAFLRAATAWDETSRLPWHAVTDRWTLPVVVGGLGALHGLPARLLVASTLQSASSNLAWIATRLVPLGQSSTLAMIASLETVVTGIADRSLTATLDDLGSSALLADLASLQHEQLDGRVCQT
ncbi:MAG: hypothetical protein HKN42_01410 [Granulosicoccus sp.]|nr:hypothetical protein [Granulosicoccus sp.]